MEEPYNTFDTFTVGENFAPGEDPLLPPPKAPILARLPRLAVGEQRSNRFDGPEIGGPEKRNPEQGIIGAHAPTTSAPTKAPSLGRAGNPAETIRFDTVLTSDGFVEANQDKTDQPLAARDQAISLHEVPAPEGQKTPALYPIAEFDSWLLNLEATVMPYSRWIALAAVIAALGLTMILLRGSTQTNLVDAPLPSNQVDNLNSTSDLFLADESTTLPIIEEGLQPFNASSEIITNTLATTSVGPTGHVAPPQARLAQQVQPIEPFRVRSETERTEVAMQPPAAGYPRTAASGPLAPMTSQGSTLR